ncbi:MAG: contractile injection system protein, VgrG/Pvc8 family [Gammaproteobacteria bacterium]|jgi:phage protein D
MSAEPQIANEAIYRARPLIEINDQTDAMVQRLLLAMQMNETEGGLASLELRLQNSALMEQQGVDYAFEFSDNDLLSLGNDIKVYSGDENDPQEIFRGKITGLEIIIEEGAQPELIVLAEDELQKARMQRKTRVFTETTVADIADSLAQELGLTAVIHELQENVAVEVQLNESNLAFLRRLLARYDSDLQVVADELHVSARNDVRRNEISLDVNSQLTGIRILADLSQQVTEVTFSGWDVAQGQAISVSRSESINAGPGQGTSGSQILNDTLGERSEHISNTAVVNEREAQTYVDTCFAQRERKFVTAEGCSIGNPEIRVGTHMTLMGVGPRFENTYYITSACHRYDLVEGYKTDFKAQCAFFGI